MTSGVARAASHGSLSAGIPARPRSTRQIIYTIDVSVYIAVATDYWDPSRKIARDGQEALRDYPLLFVRF